ncbi:S-type pyocin domain-containing protein [Pseudomonas sp. 21LCFQ02]|uniref:S-type pyocin domain-containing protein n=1 Tax=Pseudomonas sp. 21LCFQ02 TaxID=2957505 RepID=UPI00209A918E|nr:S-type pyocin domain-containing protein [Pseudomonas sp. 21LCFQ02]MCO8167489.1 S-type pyocin domain-containing protein [Pseudomonas sp. 21LCFQ02]
MLLLNTNTLYLPPISVSDSRDLDDFRRHQWEQEFHRYQPGGWGIDAMDLRESMGSIGSWVAQFNSAAQSLAQEHEKSLSELGRALLVEIDSVALHSPLWGPSHLQQLTAKISALHHLYVHKDNELTSIGPRVSRGFGHDRNANLSHFMKWAGHGQEGYEKWHDSIVAWYRTRVLWEAKSFLERHLPALERDLQIETAGLEHERHLQVMAHQRDVERRAREAVEQQVRQLAAEQRAREHALQQAAAEQARLQAEQQALQLAQQVAVEQEAQRQADEAAQKAQAAAESDPQSIPLTELKPLTGTLIPVMGPGRVASWLNTPQAKAAAAKAAGSLARYLDSFIRSADQMGAEVSRQAVSAVASLRTTIQDFGGFFSGSLPAADVLPPNRAELSDIAARQGSVEVPGWGLVLGEVAGAVELPEISVNAAAHVEVRSATFHSASNTWSVALPAHPGVSLIWTPVAPPPDSSTALPAAPPTEMPYIGVPLSPIESETYPLPVAPPELHGLITVFPAESGVAPLFTVYSSPYPGATVKGMHSGRFYNSEKAGGSIQNLRWEDAVVTRVGIDLVKLHTGRLSYSAANAVMIERLEIILAGGLEMSDTDRRYYTHELRELERYRSAGVDDGPVPEGIMGEVWNNAHTATLEDFKLKDDSELLYTPEARAAEAERVQREYKEILRGVQ